MLKKVFMPRRSQLASFSFGIVDRYQHLNGTVLTVRRERMWRRDADAATWAADYGYAPLGWRISLWNEQGAWPEQLA